MIHGHGGNIYELARRVGCDPSEIVDMSSNVNPMGPPPGLAAFLKNSFDRITALPEVDSAGIRRAFSKKYGVDAERVIAGNGTTQFIYSIPLALGSRHALILVPAYADYADACRMHGTDISFLTAGPETSFAYTRDEIAAAIEKSGADLVFICNPNNPTGVYMAPETVQSLCAGYPDAVFVVDESYLSFLDGGEAKSLMHQDRYDNLIVLHSMSKIFGIPGLRIGFAVASGRLIQRLDAYNLPWCANSLAQAAVSWLMASDKVDGFVAETLALLEAEKAFFCEKLAAADYLALFPSTTSFVLAMLSKGHTAASVCRRLGDRRILIRNCDNFQGLDHRFVRFSLKLRPQNQRLVAALEEIALQET
ncbi:MAG: threonine-phosphate decarboxylase CobD [Thermodesulfobacteriota bacterium]|nr:threonine-phosphate decarboxylase CobD [Thermodesulfobacteriota bacterium]